MKLWNFINGCFTSFRYFKISFFYIPKVCLAWDWLSKVGVNFSPIPSPLKSLKGKD